METLTLTEILQAVSTVGFPIVCCAWFMWKGHASTLANTDAINNLANVVDNNTKMVERVHQWDGTDRRQS